MREVKCPVCHGSGKRYDHTAGEMTDKYCIACTGTGILPLSEESYQNKLRWADGGEMTNVRKAFKRGKIWCDEERKILKRNRKKTGRDIRRILLSHGFERSLYAVRKALWKIRLKKE